MQDKQRLIAQIRILRCQMGDRQALAELIGQHQAALMYFTQTLMQDSDAAEDIAQETWLTVIRKIQSLKDPDSFTSWLYRIARNYCYKKLRQKGVSLSLDENCEATDCSDNEKLSYEDIAKLHESLGKLAPAHKEVLMLRFVENMSYDEIARVTDTGIGTVRSRIHYAKKALKKEMEK